MPGRKPQIAVVGVDAAISDAVTDVLRDLSSALPTMSDDVVVERYAHVGHIFGHITEVCARVGADRVVDIPPGVDRDLADALIDEEVELAVPMGAKVTGEMEARITARRLELNDECPSADRHEIGRAAGDPRTRPSDNPAR